MLGAIYPNAYAFSGRTGREGDYVMPGIRVDRLLASTAVALLLAAAAGGALADPSSASSDKPMSRAPPRRPAQHRPVRLRHPRPHRQPRRSLNRRRAPRPQRHNPMRPALQRQAPPRAAGRPGHSDAGDPFGRDGQHAGGFRHRDRCGATCRACPDPMRRSPISCANSPTASSTIRSQQERPDADRRVLLRPQLQAAVDHRRSAR